MWQITWMLGFLPDWFWSLILILGVVGLIASWILKKIPFVSSNALAIKVISVIFLLVGVYFQGVFANEAKWQAEMKKLEEQVKEAENKATETNTKLAAEIEEKKKLAAQKNREIVKFIDRWQTKEILKEVPVEGPERIRVEEVIKYIENCPVPKEMIDIHNNAAKGVKK